MSIGDPENRVQDQDRAHDDGRHQERFRHSQRPDRQNTNDGQYSHSVTMSDHRAPSSFVANWNDASRASTTAARPSSASMLYWTFCRTTETPMRALPSGAAHE